MTVAPDQSEVQTMPSPGVVPYLQFDGDSARAADFYARAFGAVDRGRLPDEADPDRLMHCQLEINGGGLMMSDMRAPSETDAVERRGFHLQLVVADGDRWWARAVEAGCKVLVPFERMFWGDRWGLLEDPFGITWGIDEPAR